MLKFSERAVVVAKWCADKILQMTEYSIDTFGQLEPFVKQEWLLTNGLGGFAFSSLVGCNTRRYHGLLIAATNPPVGRVSILSRLGEMLILDGEKTHELAVNQFNESVHPRGYMYLRRFELGTTAKWIFDVDGVSVVKELLVPWKKNAVGVRYTIDAGNSDRAMEVRVWPFFALRDFHALRRAAGYDMPCAVEASGKAIAVSSDRITGYVACDASELTPSLALPPSTGGGSNDGEPTVAWVSEPAWWYGHVYSIETDRGQDDREDLFTPGRFTAKVNGRGVLTFWSTDASGQNFDWAAEFSRRAEAIDRVSEHVAAPSPGTRQVVAEHFSSAGSVSPPNSVIGRLLRAANDFVVDRRTPDGKPGTSVLAGYPWFADWGRDTFISLPGLLLLPGRFEEAKQVLAVFAAYVSDGMIPNRFDDYTNLPEYNTVDASLWFIHSAFEYFNATNDRETFEKILRPACAKIIDGYRRGTRFKIAMDPADGLITQGDEQTQLTWMDAKCNGVAFTPREGKPVEINALWYHALVLMGEKELSAKAQASFVKAFWISPFRGLADVVRNSGLSTQHSGLTYDRDNSIRPNQIFAASLPNSPLSLDQQSAVVEVVRRELLTPMGLRTLARSDPRYRGKYSGNQFVRDQSYHTGMVWPWLIGGFLDAYLRVHSSSTDAKAQAKRWLSPLIDAMDQTCLGQLSEIFEGDEPHRAVGCCAQAWSIAEVLRLAVKLGM